MIVIRPQQMDAFARASECEFRRRLIRVLRESLGEQYEITEAFVEKTLAAGRGYGVTSEEALADFVGLAVQYGSEFHRHAAVHAILERGVVPPDRRVAALFQRLTAADWSEIADHAGTQR